MNEYTKNQLFMHMLSCVRMKLRRDELSYEKNKNIKHIVERIEKGRLAIKMLESIDIPEKRY